MMTHSRRGCTDFDHEDDQPSLFSPADASERARKLLSQHPHFYGRTEAFEFEMTEDKLVVRGRVPTYYLKQLLQNALKQFDGVRVDNRVDVRWPDGRGGDYGSLR